MKDFFIDFYIEPFRDDLFMGIMGFFTWLLTLALLFGAIYGILFLVDYSWRPINDGAGIVVEKEFIPEHTQTIMVYNAATKTTMPQIIHYSDEWKVYIKVDNIIGSKSISKNTYSNIDVNQSIDISYSYGRIWKKLYVKKILRY